MLAGPALARPPKPVVTGFSPTKGPYGGKVTIAGSHLARATVMFNGNLASVSVNRAGTRITATVPVPDDRDGVVTGPIAVVTPGGATQTVARFTLVREQSSSGGYAQPRITGVSPARAKPGSTVTIKGAGVRWCDRRDLRRGRGDVHRARGEHHLGSRSRRGEGWPNQRYDRRRNGVELVDLYHRMTPVADDQVECNDSR